MPKPLEKFPLYISVISAIIVLLACIAVSAPLYWMATWVSLTIVIFYVIGHAIRFYLIKEVFPPEEEMPEIEDEEHEDGEAEEQEDYEEPGEEGGADDSEMESESVGDAFLDN